jgi:Tol biopolymer transport system component
MQLTFTRSCLAVLLAFLASPSWLTLAADKKPTDEARFLTNIRQLSFEGRRSGEGYFSPDGKALIFQSEREADNPFYQIYLLDLTTGDTRRVSPGFGKTTCAFFRPETDEVIFASTHLDTEAKAKQKAELDFRAAGKQRRYSWDYDEQMDIFSARRDGSQLKRLTDSPGYDAEGSYSPEGNKIVFCSLRDAYPTNKLSAADLKRLESDPAYFGEIYLMNADGSDQRRLTHSPGYDGGPFFSPDGERIIWRHFEEDGLHADIFTMKLDGSDVRRLTDFHSMSWAPYFHPSGKYVIFTSNTLGFDNFELYLVDADGLHAPVRITFTPGFDGLPVFSPDGKKLCWTSGRTSDGKSQLFLANWNHEATLAALGRAPAQPVESEVGNPSSIPGPVPPALTRSLSAEISVDDLRAEVGFLASDALEGRMTGTRGSHLAGDFLAEQLRLAGLQPLGASNSFFQSFDFSSAVRLVTNRNRLSILRHQTGVTVPTFEIDKGFRPLSFTANGTVEGEVIFAGYGLVVPGKPGEGYDSYAGLNVSNYVVLALRYVPEGVDAKRRAELNRYAGLRYKAMIARERGAKAIIFVTGPNSPNAGELVEFTKDTSLSGSGIVAGSISGEVAATLLSQQAKNLKTLQTELDTENPHITGFPLPNLTVRVSASVEYVKGSDRNVMAHLPPAAGSGEYVVIGAHYDHLGFGESGAMRRKGEEKQIHSGADDNASGTAAVLELAANFAAERRRQPDSFKRGLLFALWSGEEIGLIGSSYFVEHPLVPLTNVVAYVNFDMVGRLRENKLTLTGIGSSLAWRRLIEKRNVAAGFDLVLQDDPYAPTDVTAFYPKNVPVLNFFTGSHDEYHRPADKPDTLNYEGLERVTQLAGALVLDLANAGDRPDYIAMARSDAGGGARENLRAYLGTIPDYATEVEGVKLSGVRGGSPADKAGLKGGDVIVEFAGTQVKNIYDYTYALDAVKIGQPVNVVVKRDGQRVTLSVIAESRK